jgi:hypothetical protein
LRPAQVPLDVDIRVPGPGTLRRPFGCSRSPPRATRLTAGEYSSSQLAEYGLDPPRFILAVAEGGGNTTRVGFGESTPAQNAQYVRIVGRPELFRSSPSAGASSTSERPG